MDPKRGRGPELNIRRGRSQVSDLHVHLVFVTKNRRGAPTVKILARCEEIMIDVCCDFGATLVEFNGQQDQFHLLVEHPPVMQISSFV